MKGSNPPFEHTSKNYVHKKLKFTPPLDNKSYEPSNALSDSPIDKLITRSVYRAAVDSNLTSGTLVSLARDLFAKTTYLLG
jgi:hypothetical protein